MAGVVAFLTFMLAAGYLQGYALYHQQQRRELAGFFLVWFAVTVFTLMVLLDAPLPKMLDALEALYAFLEISV